MVQGNIEEENTDAIDMSGRCVGHGACAPLIFKNLYFDHWCAPRFIFLLLVCPQFFRMRSQFSQSPSAYGPIDQSNGYYFRFSRDTVISQKIFKKGGPQIARDCAKLYRLKDVEMIKAPGPLKCKHLVHIYFFSQNSSECNLRINQALGSIRSIGHRQWKRPAAML